MLCYTTNSEALVLDLHLRDFSHKSRLLNLKELLIGLDYHSKRKECIANQQNNLNIFLRQINIASHLLQHIKTDSTLMFIKTQCRVECLKNGHSREDRLSVKVTNESMFTLTPDWNFHILLTLPGQSKTKTETHGFFLSSGLKAKTDFQVTIPFSDMFTSSGGFTATVLLILNLDTSVLTECPTVPVNIPVLVSSQVFDVLCFLEDDIGCQVLCAGLNEIMWQLAAGISPRCPSSSTACVEINTVYSTHVPIPITTSLADLLTGLSMFTL